MGNFNEYLGYLVPCYLVLLFGFIAVWFYLTRNKRNIIVPQIEEDSWKMGEQELTIIYKKGAKPEQQLIDHIKQNMQRYESLVHTYINNHEEYKEATKTGLLLEGISFPVFENESYDFSVDFCFVKDEDRSLVACFKDEQVQKLLMD